MSETIDPRIDAASKFFKDTLWDTTIDAVLTALFVKAPYLSWWPMKQVITGIIKLITNTVFSKIKLLVDLQAITLINAKNRREYTEAIFLLNSIAAEHGIESKEFQDAREAAKIRLRDLVKFLA